MWVAGRGVDVYNRQLMNSAISKSVLLAIPYFILAGVIMEYAGISKRLIDVAEVFFGHIKGGMIIVTCVVACFFAAISGSGPATVAAIGGILIPGMVRSGYNKSMSASLVDVYKRQEYKRVTKRR